MAMEQVGWEAVSYLRSYTGEMVAPVRPGEDPRKGHPGGWSDITGALANHYRFELFASGRRVRWMPEPTGPEGELQSMGVSGTIPRYPGGPCRLEVINGADYAAALESHDGYYVLSGIMDPGGPVEAAVRRAAVAIGLEVL